MEIKFTGASHIEDNMTMDKNYTILAFSKNLDCYRVEDDAGIIGWHHRDNFETVSGVKK